MVDAVGVEYAWPTPVRGCCIGAASVTDASRARLSSLTGACMHARLDWLTQPKAALDEAVSIAFSSRRPVCRVVHAARQLKFESLSNHESCGLRPAAQGTFVRTI